MMESESTSSTAPPLRRRFRACWLWCCVPLVVWLGVVAVNSTDLASSAHTDVLLLRFWHLFVPEQTAAGSDFEALSWALRKTAHVVEYAVLGILLARALRALFPRSMRGTGRELLWRTAAVVTPFGLLVSVVDEFHQTLVASRMGSAWDVAADLLGLLIGVAVVWLVWRQRDP